jgi:hypothetical protein
METNMKTNTETTNDPTPKTAKTRKPASAPAVEEPTPQPVRASKPGKASKPAKVDKADTDGESSDRLPTTLDELKETKGGFVASQFLAGKDRDTIAKDLASTFKLTEPQATKIVRRITGRVRLYARVFELVPAKK